MRDSEERLAELERVVAELRARLLTLARVLPAEYLPYLEGGVDAADAVRAAVWSGVDDSTALVSSDVASELQLLWERLSTERS